MGENKTALNVNDKTRYAIHVRNLKYYLQQGLRLTKVHRCLKFIQGKWLKPYIDFNTEKGRTQHTILKKICSN